MSISSEASKYIVDHLRMVSGNDGTVRVWDVSSGKELLTLRGHKLWRVSEVSVSPDGKRIASCGEDKTVRIWNAVEDCRPMAFKSYFQMIA